MPPVKPVDPAQRKALAWTVAFRKSAAPSGRRRLPQGNARQLSAHRAARRGVPNRTSGSGAGKRAHARRLPTHRRGRPIPLFRPPTTINSRAAECVPNCITIAGGARAAGDWDGPSSANGDGDGNWHPQASAGIRTGLLAAALWWRSAQSQRLVIFGPGMSTSPYRST